MTRQTLREIIDSIRQMDYLRVHSPGGRLVLKQSEAGVCPVIWYAALTGGFVGSIARFDGDELWLDPTD